MTADSEIWSFGDHSSAIRDTKTLDHLISFGVSKGEAEKAIKSQNRAFGAIFKRFLAGATNVRNAEFMERFWFEAYRKEPHKAIEAILKADWVAKERYHPNVPAFYRRLSQFLNSKGYRPDISTPESRWKTTMITCWTFGPMAGHPPFCLLSDQFISDIYFPDANLTPAAVRKEISRLKLYRPHSPRFGFEDGPKKGGARTFRYIRRAAGVVTKKI